MRRLTLFISVALALLVFAIPATASAKRSHHKSRHHRVADRNHNGIPDRWEHKFRVHKATADPDRDGVTNIGEFHNGTNPRDADTDNDGVKDGNDDANDDGIDDGDEQSADTRHDGESESGDDNSGSGSTNSGDDDQGDDNNDQGENENEGNCGPDALQAQTIVKEAELRLTSGGAVFEEIKLGGKAPA